MTKLRVASFSISIDGFGAGPDQSLENPLGFGGAQLHAWAFPTRTMRRAVFGHDDGSTGLDDDFVARGFENVGAWILGRNMFGPVRGPWPDESWKGWWGEEPPYHVPVFVLTSPQTFSEKPPGMARESASSISYRRASRVSMVLSTSASGNFGASGLPYSGMPWWESTMC